MFLRAARWTKRGPAAERVCLGSLQFVPATALTRAAPVSPVLCGGTGASTLAHGLHLP
jgi:hypothetical protein